MAKKYYWLKLPENFFKDSKPLKKLRKIAGGDTYTIIYLKMLLASLKNDGLICLDGLEERAADEIALEIDEEPDNVEMTLRFLFNTGLLEERTDAVFLPQVQTMVGSETDSAERKRRQREREKLSVTMSHRCNAVVTDRHTEIEKREEKREEIDTENRVESKTGVNEKRKRFTPPTLQEVEQYCRERGNRVDAQRWYDYYSSIGWKVGKNSMKDWKACVRTWERNYYSTYNSSVASPTDDTSDLDEIF